MRNSLSRNERKSFNEPGFAPKNASNIASVVWCAESGERCKGTFIFISSFSDPVRMIRRKVRWGNVQKEARCATWSAMSDELPHPRMQPKLAGARVLSEDRLDLDIQTIMGADAPSPHNLKRAASRPTVANDPNLAAVNNALRVGGWYVSSY